MQYRAEITGLRAIAVLPVILFHAGVSVFSGGYVGVDIFFVLSGYLISSIILADLDAGQFSLVRFYQRRARRILPALYLVLACSILPAWALMVPDQLAAYGRSLFATVLFVSNAHFWESTGYFAMATDNMPLLHTWSLAVEEQFYFLFPLILIALVRGGRIALLAVCALLLLASLALADWGARHEPDVNFFFTFSRFWELLAGALCAVVLRGRGPWQNDVLGALGLGMIGLSIFAYDGAVPFPSLFSLLPVGGTVLVILFASGAGRVARLLGLRPLVWIGLVSYSAYLWHQPLFAYARVFSITHPAPALMGALAVLSVLLGWASWAWVEEPIRRKRWAWFETGARPLAALVLVSGALVAVGMALFATGGAPGRLDARAQNWAAATNRDTSPLPHCLFDRDTGLSGHPFAECTYAPDDSAPRVMLLGDSHADAIAPEVQMALGAAGISSYAVAYSGCVGLQDLFRVDKPRNHQCIAFNDAALAHARSAGIDTLVITSRFTLYWNGYRFVNGEGGHEPGLPQFVDLAQNLDRPGGLDSAARRDRVLTAYAARLADLSQDFHIILVQPIPEAGWHVPETLVKLALRGRDTDLVNLTTSAAAYHLRNDTVRAVFTALASDRITLVDPAAVLCDQDVPGRCINDRAGQALYVDDDHLSDAGARLIAPLIVQAVARAAP